uniref:Nicotinamide-nucleotide adenylyltransferase n=1 Tax=Heterorhabditis bacteriophora TaxID=37862 RepID=A0A1I7XRA7_HETBA
MLWSEGSRIALLACGSFNPPTLMHLRMLEVAKNYLEHNLRCAVVDGIMSPVADSFGKPYLASASHRIAMVRAASETSSWIRVDDWECVQPRWSRTLSVMKHHRKELRERFGPDTNIALVVGGDVVDSFTKILPNGDDLWNPEEVREIITEFGLIVISRDGSNPVYTLSSMDALRDVADMVQLVVDEVCPCAVSSTKLRSAIAGGKSIMYTTPNDVIKYIHANKLYKM